jgi:AbrB family looped-hinge helix DNA binding protein
MKATITSKGQVTIPHRVRRKLNLKPGDVLDFDETSPFVLARPAFDEKKMRFALGCLQGRMDKTSAEWLEEARGPVDNQGEGQ